MALKPKNRKKAYRPKTITHSNNLATTGLFNRRNETAVALGRLESMDKGQTRELMEALVHDYGKTYFRINLLTKTYEKVGPNIDLYMLMRIYWDVKITIYSLPRGVESEGLSNEELDHYELTYKHRQRNTLPEIRRLLAEIAMDFMDSGTDAFMIRIDSYPVLPYDDGLDNERFEIENVATINYEYDPLDPHNTEFRHRPRTCDKMNGWSFKKFEENRNVILRKLVQNKFGKQ